MSVELGSGWSVRMSGLWGVSRGQEAAWGGGDRDTVGHQLTGSALLSITGWLWLWWWLAVVLEPRMAPAPALGKTMVPLVPALVMLGLVAGAHGDSKSGPSGCRTSRVQRWRS